jgi:hypothetical protein
MPNLEYFIVAESFSVDQITNRVSIFNVLERVNVASLPIALPQAIAIAHWNMTEDEIGKDFQAELVAFADEPVATCRANFRAMHARHRTFMGFSKLNVSRSGKHRFELKLNGVPKAHHEIDIVLSPELAIAAAASESEINSNRGSP